MLAASDIRKTIKNIYLWVQVALEVQAFLLVQEAPIELLPNTFYKFHIIIIVVIIVIIFAPASTKPAG